MYFSVLEKKNIFRFLSLLIVGCGSKATIKLSQSEIKLFVGEMYDIYPVVTGVEGNDAVKYEAFKLNLQTWISCTSSKQFIPFYKEIISL